jgi:UPF0716 protein FxsA
MLSRFVVVLAAWALAEIASLVAFGRAVGVAPTLAWVMVAAVLGGLLVRSQGFAHARRMRAAMAQGQLPAGPLFDGMAMVVAGLLLIVPGLLGDALAVALLLPQVRRGLLGALIPRFLGGVDRRPGGRTAESATVIEGEARRVRD